MPILVYFFIVLLIVFLVVVGRMMKAEGFGVECSFCAGNARFLEHVNEDDRRRVKQFFYKIEDRVPAGETVLACDDCRRVYANGRYRGGVTPIKCRICRHHLVLVEGRCVECQTPYDWIEITDCAGYRFLMPADLELDPPEPE